VPAPAVEGMRGGPIWSRFAALAHTLPYDLALNESGMGVPAEELGRITVPTLAIDGGESPPWMRAAVQAVAGAVPGARYLTIEGQDHSILHHPEALAPLVDFLT
jgi:pimeloyl-ACP methyl ester carboxylesterase